MAGRLKETVRASKHSVESPLALRKRLERERIQAAEASLRQRTQILERQRRELEARERSSAALYQTLYLTGVDHYQIRPSDTYKLRSYNREKNRVALIDHLFVKYPAPRFLYQCFLTSPVQWQKQAVLAIYRKWFVTIAQGGSFSKLVKGFMTSKECALFLGLDRTTVVPADLQEIHNYAWAAKMQVAGIAPRQQTQLIRRVLNNYLPMDADDRLSEMIQFYARFGSEMDPTTFGELTDFVAWRLANDRSFSFKGRTISSMLKLAIEWQELMQKAKLGAQVTWEGLRSDSWLYEDRSFLWEAIQLLNNHELMNEGRIQRHCVYSYVEHCRRGLCFIYSLRKYHKIRVGESQIRGKEISRVTIEVTPHRVAVQIRGRQNRLPNEEERAILQRWGGEAGIEIRSGKYW